MNRPIVKILKDSKMYKYRVVILYLMTLSLLMGGCKLFTTEPTLEEEYAAQINSGWNAYTLKDYAGALEKFRGAQDLDSLSPAAYVGLGWTLMKMDSLQQAEAVFSGYVKISDSSASIFAGWAFLLNAQKQYSSSNDKVDLAVKMDANWIFNFELLTANSLHILKAENFYMLGDFPRSQAEVQIVNPEFSADLNTPQGLAKLAAEIESLRNQSSMILVKHRAPLRSSSK